MVGLGLTGYSSGAEPSYGWRHDENFLFAQAASGFLTNSVSINAVIRKILPRDEQPPSGTYGPLFEIVSGVGTLAQTGDPPAPHLDRVFSAYFNLADMERLADFDIRFTDNLLNHLYLERYTDRLPRTTLWLFDHVAALEMLRTSCVS